MARRPSRNIPLVGRHLRGLLDLLIFGLLSPASFQGADTPDEEAADNDENDAAGREPAPRHQFAFALGGHSCHWPLSSVYQPVPSELMQAEFGMYQGEPGRGSPAPSLTDGISVNVGTITGASSPPWSQVFSVGLTPREQTGHFQPSIIRSA